MGNEIPQRKLLTLAIIAFDLIVKDCLADDNRGKDFHPIAVDVLKILIDMLSCRPNLNKRSQQYLLNVAEISADIKHIFLKTPVSDDDLLGILVLQANRLEILKDMIHSEKSQEDFVDIAGTVH